MSAFHPQRTFGAPVGAKARLRPIADIATLPQSRAMLIRPLPFFIASGIAISNLLCFAFLPARTDVFAAPGFAVAGAILFWMLALVRGDHGFMGRIVGVEKDRTLRFPLFARLLLAAGTCLLLVGFDLQARKPAAISLFTSGLAIVAAGSTQLRRADGI